MSKYRVKMWIGEVSGTEYFKVERLKAFFWFPISGHTQYTTLESAMSAAKKLKDGGLADGHIWYV